MVRAMTLFIDSSLPVEHIKGSKGNDDLLAYLLSFDFDLVINSVVFSEVMFKFLTIHGEKSGLALKQGNAIGKILEGHDAKKILKYFRFDGMNDDPQEEALRLMQHYNLLPNDALILAHCINSRIQFVASYDSDFIIPYREEGITLIDSIGTFQRVFSIE